MSPLLSDYRRVFDYVSCTYYCKMCSYYCCMFSSDPSVLRTCTTHSFMCEWIYTVHVFTCALGLHACMGEGIYCIEHENIGVHLIGA